MLLPLRLKNELFLKLLSNSNSYILAGKVVGVHGVRGLIKVLPLVEKDLFKPRNHFYLATDQGKPIKYEIKTAKPHKRFVLMALKGIENRSLAEPLVGLEFKIQRSELPPLEENTYYWSDIIGLNVFDKDGDVLGEITSIIDTGSNDVYVVNGDREILIPALESVVKTIDIKNNTMKVDLPEGL